MLVKRNSLTFPTCPVQEYNMSETSPTYIEIELYRSQKQPWSEEKKNTLEMKDKMVSPRTITSWRNQLVLDLKFSSRG